jgi:hypothetical protein
MDRRLIPGLAELRAVSAFAVEPRGALSGEFGQRQRKQVFFTGGVHGQSFASGSSVTLMPLIELPLASVNRTDPASRCLHSPL